jgi:hypothetical protein
MRTSEAIRFYGDSKAALAAACGIAPPSIHDWGEYPPPLRQKQLEELTGGQLKAEPDVYSRRKQEPSKPDSCPAETEK